MRIAQYIHRVDFEDGGPPRAVVDLSRVLHERGHEVTLVTTVSRDVPRDWLDGGDGPRVLVLPRPALPGELFKRAQLAPVGDLMKQLDLLQLHGPWERANSQLGGLARSAGVPYVISLRGMLDDWSMAQSALKKRIYMMLKARRLLEGAAFVHCTADDELAQSGKWFPRGQGRVVPNLIDLEPYADLPGPEEARAAYPFLKDGPVLLFLSRIHVKKGIEHLIEAACRLCETGHPVQVAVVGSGDEAYVDRLRRQVAEAGLQDRVHFLGHVDGSLKFSLYQAGDVFVLPTSQENFGFVQFEALACGTPVMTTNLVDTWREVVSSGGGVAVDQDAGAIVEGLIPLLEDPSRREDMGRQGREWVLEHLAVDRIASQLEAMYDDAASKNGP
ncbi:MAG: glycosyltransferase [Phycisphaerales bacterium]|nr:glycosyltransferase [Phycisphaerales bacterium]